MTTTAITHDAIKAIAETWKIDRVYSPVLLFAAAIGRKTATVTSVPVNMGNAGLGYAKLAARKRANPCSSLIAIISTAMMASSPRGPRERNSGPGENLCSPQSGGHLKREVTASNTR